MTVVAIADLKPGMVLAADVVGGNGRLLLSKDSLVEERHIRVFNIWGVIQVDVADIPQPDGEDRAAAEPDPERLGQAVRRADAMFAEARLTTPPLAALHALCVREFAQRRDTAGPSPVPPPPEAGSVPVEPARPLRQFVESDAGLASFPDVYFKIQQTLSDPASTADSLAEAISKDPSISAKLLSLVNSPFYGFTQRIDSLSRGVTLVGAKELSQLAIGVAVMDMFASMPEAVFSLKEFWKHSLACGVFCRLLASILPGAPQERCFVIGLLHDIGRLVMVRIDPRRTLQAFELARREHVALFEAERRVFGFDHCQVARELFQRWRFPVEMTVAVFAHHDPASSGAGREAAVCAVADTLAVALAYGSNGNGLVHDPPPGAWESLHLPESALGVTVSKAKRQIDDIVSVFAR